MKHSKTNLKPEGTFLSVNEQPYEKIHYTIKFKFRNGHKGRQELENAINHSGSLNAVIFNLRA